ncbi:MAG: hypothetical protein LAQ69_07315 [Acidobacteriia bacterium]|nr:hypothetical protein [Terriglobia bacterium]
MKCVALVFLAAGLLPAGDSGGIRPRGNPTDYPAHQTGKGVTIAAAVVAPEQVAKLFATDLNRGGYIVVEVAVYPEAGGEVAVLSRDFLLRIGSDPTTARPVSAQTIASALQRKNAPPKPRSPGDVTVYPTATIGYESGSYNGQRRGGVYTAAGVGVGIGDPGPGAPPRPASTDVDRSTMQQELEDKGLPEGKTTEALAGYLFFLKPASAKRTAPSLHLTYYAADGEVSLVIPPPRRK